MIINNGNNVFETNMQPDKSMAFGISDVSLVMEVLSTLYKHSVRTLVQEYICNGRDAMREAGTWGKMPMKIGVPNNFERTFKVRDYGVGISPDRMANIFVNYGSSTKRNTNTQTGGFGIGAKSAFSYTDSFTVVSFYNGIQYTYVCYMTKEKGGCDLLSQMPTKEANGVEIAVPVKQESVREFREAVQRCVEFWQEEITFEGITEGEIVQFKPIVKLGKMIVFPNNNRESNTIYLIDGVQYDLLRLDNYRWNNFNPASSDHTIAIEIPNGYFKLSPSRENIQDTIDNKQKQQALEDECKQLIEKKQHEIASIKGIKQIMEQRKLYSGFYNITQLTIPLSDNFKLIRTDLVYDDCKLEVRFARKKRRSASWVIEHTQVRSVDITKTVLIKTAKDTNKGTLARRINNYVLQKSVTALVMSEDIPFESELFQTIINSETLPMPSVNRTLGSPKKSTKTSIAYIKNCHGSKMQTTMDRVNGDPRPSLIYEEGMDLYLAQFFTIYEIPKANKDLLTKKLFTEQEAHAELLKRKSEALSLSCHNFKGIKSLSHISALTHEKLKRYLMKDESFRKELDVIKELEYSLIEKYPLMKVLRDSLSKESVKILTDEINKQIGG